MKITRMRTNRMENPLGFYMESARISYVAEESRGSRQTAECGFGTRTNC